LAYAEYEVGDYHRRFTLSNEIDRDNIAATVKDGVLRLHLPKSGPAKARKISVKSA
jgi:HSP20 family protein